jgi:hypothetical protein
MRLLNYLKQPFEYVDLLSEEWDMKHISGKSTFSTNVPPEKRSLGNIPRNTSDKKLKVRFQDWLEIKTEKGYPSHGKSSNGKWYGWSHRAVFGFGVGDKVVKGCCGNIRPGEEWIIKTDDEAKKQAISFAKDVS